MKMFLIKTRERKKAVPEYGSDYPDGKESFLSVTMPVMTIRGIN